MDFEKLREKLYNESPFDLDSVLDDAYREGVDNAIQMIESAYYNNKR